MIFKRPRLRLARPLVNVGLAASLIFISGCSDEKPQDAGARIENSGNEPVVEIITRSKLQAVWSTNTLSGEIVDVAVSGGPNPILAATLGGGQIQLFDLDGERLTDPVTVGAQKLANGFPATLGGAQVTLFPGIGSSGDLNIYLYSPNLGAPVAIDLLRDVSAAGLCTGQAQADGALLDIGYWTTTAPLELITGSLYEADGEFVWQPVTSKTQSTQLGGCILQGETGTETGNMAGAMDMAVIGKTDAQKKLLQLGADGQLQEIRPDGSADTLPIRAGISIGVPSPITAFTTLPDAQFGGYPDGVIIVAGAVAGAQKLVFVEPIGLFGD